MIISLLLLIVVRAVLADNVPGCDETYNDGVLNEFGPLPSTLYDSKYYYQVVFLGQAYTKFDSPKHLKGYIFEYLEFRERRGWGSGVKSYYRIMYRESLQYRTLDFIRVDPDKKDNVKAAILDADETPSADKKIRIKFLLSDCTCVMRTYNLNTNDIASAGVSSPCKGEPQEKTVNFPHSIGQSSSKDILSSANVMMALMGANDMFPLCDTNNNNGVLYEFGRLPSALRDTALYRPVHGVGYTSEGLDLTGYLTRYRVQYAEYMSVCGSHVYGYLTLYFSDHKTSSYKVLDYLRVDTNRWRHIQQAVLEGYYKADINGFIRIKYLTSDCKCVQRMYDMKVVDIVGTATSSACNGDPIRTPPHAVTQPPEATPLVKDVSTLKLTDRYPGCDVNDNMGVLDVFGILPKDLFDVQLFYEVVNPVTHNTKFSLWYPLYRYSVTYSEYRSQSRIPKTYAFLTLYYRENSEYILLDYLRVDPNRWENIQVAILEASPKVDASRKLKIRYLTADCTCKMREYDLRGRGHDVAWTSYTLSCEGLPFTGQPPSTTTVEEQVNLERAGKANYNRWS